MQLYILDKDPVKSAYLLPIKLKGKNYAQKMLIELGQCLSNMLGNEQNGLYKYKAVPPQFISFIFLNQNWVLRYYLGLYHHCFNNYFEFENTATAKNFMDIHFFAKKIFSDSQRKLDNAWFIPQKEYGKRKYLPIDECIEQYKKYLEWKMEE